MAANWTAAFDQLEKHRDDPEVVAEALTDLYGMKDNATFPNCKVFDYVASNLWSYRDDDVIRRRCLRLLAHLFTVGEFYEKSWTQWGEIIFQVFGVTLSTPDTDEESIELVLNALAEALQRLPLPWESSRIGPLVLRRMPTVIQLAMERHAQNYYIQQSGLRALRSAATSDPRLKAETMNCFAFRTVQLAMENFQDSATTQRLGCDVLWTLAKQSPRNQAILRQNGAASYARRALALFPEDVDLREPAEKLLGKFSPDDSTAR
jgi:hypothetical protein